MQLDPRPLSQSMTGSRGFDMTSRWASNLAFPSPNSIYHSTRLDERITECLSFGSVLASFDGTMSHKPKPDLPVIAQNSEFTNWSETLILGISTATDQLILRTDGGGLGELCTDNGVDIAPSEISKTKQATETSGKRHSIQADEIYNFYMGYF